MPKAKQVVLRSWVSERTRGDGSGENRSCEIRLTKCWTVMRSSHFFSEALDGSTHSYHLWSASNAIIVFSRVIDANWSRFATGSVRSFVSDRVHGQIRRHSKKNLGITAPNLPPPLYHSVWSRACKPDRPLHLPARPRRCFASFLASRPCLKQHLRLDFRAHKPVMDGFAQDREDEGETATETEP